MFLKLAQASQAVGQTKARNQKVKILSEALAGLSPVELGIAVNHLAGEMPQGKLGVGPAMVYASQAAQPAESASLTISQVHEALSELGQIRGSSQKKMALQGLMRRATTIEQQFLTRLLVGELRQGALTALVNEAIAQASNVSAKSVRRALMFTRDLGAVASAALVRGEQGLAEFSLQLMQPILPMLAQTAQSPGEALASLEEAVFEDKLDGARIQVHRDGEQVRIFSRDGNEVTYALPEIVEQALTFPIPRFVLDGEAISMTPEGMPLPFQMTMRRFGRKLNVDVLRREQPISGFFFDVLRADDSQCMDEPLLRRLAILDELVPASSRVARSRATSAEDLDEFYAQALERGNEGLVAKRLSSVYDSGRRGADWLKIKPAHTLDLVVLAVEWGSGRREKWLSNIHLAARKDDSFVMLGKTFKGMTDEMLAWQTEWFLQHKISQEGHVVYVKPELVVEVAFDGVQESSQYPGGVALRFARVKRYRPDKKAKDANSLDDVLKHFRRS